MKALFPASVAVFAVAMISFAQADVSTRYKFVAADDAAASNVCVVAAQEGYAAAKAKAAKEGLELDTVFCNGRNVEHFARRYSRVNKVDVANASL